MLQNLFSRLVPKLWRKIGNVSVILQIVHNNTNDIKTDEFKTFVHEMEEDGVIIKTVAAGDMDCVLKSQLIRLFAGDLIENDDDIMLTSDVDAFPMNSSLLEPLQNKNYKIWIYQYDMAIVKEFTFSMSFIAMTKKTWRKLLRVETPEEIVAIYMKPLLLQAVSPWGYDQLILSRIILESRLCTLPTNNSLWEQVRIPPKTFDDSQTCFHGNQYGNCDRALRMRDYGCKWWHFHAFERETELNDKFKEIIGDKPAPRKAQLAFLDIKMEVQRLLGLRT